MTEDNRLSRCCWFILLLKVDEAAEFGLFYFVTIANLRCKTPSETNGLALFDEEDFIFFYFL